MKRFFPIILAVLFAVFSVSAVYAKTEDNLRDAVGMSIINFNALDTNGNTVTGDFVTHATMTVVNEWATWCGPCVNEMPHFQAMHEYYSATPEADVQILGSVYVSGSCTPASAKAFLEQNGYTWTNVIEDSVLADVFNNSNSIPNTIIVDRHGIVRDMTVGSFPSQAALQNYIEGWYEILHAEEGDAIPGDVDGDGVLTVSDALFIMRAAMGVITLDNDAVADVNGNGTVEVSDAMIVLRAAMGLA